MSVDLSVVVVSFNTWPMTKACVESLFRLQPAPSIEVIVVDNASDDESANHVAHLFPDVQLIRNSVNTGFAAASNQGIRAAQGRYVLLLNSDCEIRDKAIDRLVEFMDDHPDAGLANPKLVYGDGTLQPQRIIRPGYWSHAVWDTLLWGTPLNRLLRRKYIEKDIDKRRDYDLTVQVGWVRGAAMMIRREVFEGIGLLDDNFFFGHEEVDYCIRVERAGWKMFYVGDAAIVHHGSRSHAVYRGNIGIRIVEGQLYFWEKHGSVLQALFLRGVIAAVTLGRMGYRLLRIAVRNERRSQLVKYQSDLALLKMTLGRTYPLRERI